MNLFHDEETVPQEPVPGLPENLPEGERILWQGGPSARTLVIHAFHARFIAGYFVLATAWRLASMSSSGATTGEMLGAAGTSLAALVAAMAVLYAIAWAMARAAIFTITDARVVMRYGSAIRKYVNLPFAQVTSVDVRRYGKSAGDISIASEGRGVGYVHLWPFARPLKIARPQPMLRGLPDVDAAVKVLGPAMKAAIGDRASEATPRTRAAPAGIAAADREAKASENPAPRYVRIPAQRGAT
jgi:hypothetical protein